MGKNRVTKLFISRLLKPGVIKNNFREITLGIRLMDRLPKLSFSLNETKKVSTEQKINILEKAKTFS